MPLLDSLSSLLGPALAGVGTAFGGPAGGLAGGILGSALQGTPGAPASGGGLLGGLISGGPGRGQIRRSGAQAAVDQSPGLTAIRMAVRNVIGPVGGQRYTGTATAADFARVIRAAVQSNPAAGQALQAVLGRVAQLGGFGKAQGVEANTLGDVLKYTFGLGLVPPKGAPTVADIFAALAGNPPAPVSPLPPAPGLVASPETGAAPFIPSTPASAALAAARDFVSGSAAPPMALAEALPAPEDNMGTFLDSVGTFLGGVASGLVATPTGPMGQSPFVLPGGMPSSIGAGLGGALGAGLAGVLGLGNYQVGPNVMGTNVGGGATQLSGCDALGSPYHLTAMGGARAQVFVQSNPVTGRAEWFGPLGRPILFSRDRAVVRRVSRLAVKLSSATGHRRRLPARSRRGGR